LSMQRLIRRTRFNLAVAEQNDHVVDDDR
jgi:hypothetical protein